MKKPVCLNYQHEVLLQEYISTISMYIKEVTKSNSKYKDFIDVADVIIEHHNNYKSDVLGQANYQDFMSIIPTHFTCMCNGYLTGLETKDNSSSVRLYKHIISEQSFNLVEKLQNLEIEKNI